MKSTTFHEKHWKATKTADSTQISHLDLVFHRVQRESQLGISYILVVFGGAHVCLVVHVCVYGPCMHTYVWSFILYLVITLNPNLHFHIFMKSSTFHMKSNAFMKSTWKVKSTWKAHLKSEKHMKSTWKVTSTWKAPEMSKTHEKHLKNEKHMKTHLKREKHTKSTQKVKSARKVKSTWKAPEKWKAHENTPEMWKAHEKHLKSEKHLKNENHCFLYEKRHFSNERPFARNCNPYVFYCYKRHFVYAIMHAYILSSLNIDRSWLVIELERWLPNLEASGLWKSDNNEITTG